MEKQAELEALLSDLSKEELIQLLVEAANTDERLNNSLMIRYSKTNRDNAGQMESFKQLVESTIRRFTGKRGQIAYRDNGPLSQELYNLLADANLAADEMLAFELTLVIVEEGALAIRYTDNSDGAFCGLVEDAIQQLEEIAEIFSNRMSPSGRIWRSVCLRRLKAMFLKTGRSMPILCFTLEIS